MQELLIENGRAEKNYWRDLWRYRELFYFLAWRDILVRYKQTAIGVAWAVIRPLLTSFVLVFVFNKIGKLQPPPGVDYFLFVLAANLPWQFFATSMSEASNSLIGNSNLISKVYFPRLVVPAGAVITSFVDFLITLVLLAITMVFLRFVPGWQLCTFPLFMLLAFGAAFGIGLWLSALNVEYRDFRYIVPFIVQFGMYISPVGFSSSDVAARGQLIYAIYSLNPMVGVIEGFRWSLLAGKTPLDWEPVLISIGMVLALLVSGVWYFRRMERTFADVI